MARANVVLPDGTKVTIDGTAEEVAGLLDRLSNNRTGGATPPRRGGKTGAGAKQKARSAANKPGGPLAYIRELISEGFFKTRREIGAVRDKLEERGHIYPVTSISGPLLRLVKAKELRRLKEDRVWKYVNP